jgi:ribonuclease-3 family protein
VEQDINSRILECFDIEQKDIRNYSPLTLAFIGDGVYEVVIRSIIVGEGNTSPAKLHMHSAHYVKAASQVRMYKAVEDVLSEEEMEVFRRGRNAKSNTKAKNATTMDYRIATGYEALVGHLYLTGQNDRILELVKLGIDRFTI